MGSLVLGSGGGRGVLVMEGGGELLLWWFGEALLIGKENYRVVVLLAVGNGLSKEHLSYCDVRWQ